ncbi:MAG: methyltransferase domain-containing protein [Thermoplasmata archaeon]|nr:methyltransferase domain-containing protein [Thermoplasmata archaeon]
MSADVALDPDSAFAQVVDELVEAFARVGVRFSPGSEGSVVEGRTEVGRVLTWTSGRQFSIDWRPAPWDHDLRLQVELRTEPRDGGARVEVEVRGADSLVHADPVEGTGWVASAIVAPLLRTLLPSNLGDWLTDRAARRPSGPGARTMYTDPVYHRPNFRLLLDTLHPGPSDVVLEVGCGGGAFLQEVLARGVRAVGLDHSPEMVRLARANNQNAVGEGRLQVTETEASRLPVPDRTFTIAVSTGVFGFLPHPLDTLREMYRALAPGGRLAVFEGTKELVGTPACPEPMASRIHFFEDDELAGLAREAGFVAVEVRHPELFRYAQESGVPEEALDLFRGTVGALLLVGRRPDG